MTGSYPVPPSDMIVCRRPRPYRAVGQRRAGMALVGHLHTSYLAANRQFHPVKSIHDLHIGGVFTEHVGIQLAINSAGQLSYCRSTHSIRAWEVAMVPSRRAWKRLGLATYPSKKTRKHDPFTELRYV